VTHRPHLARTGAAVLAVGAVLLGATPAASAVGTPADAGRAHGRATYVVTLAAPPAAAYTGTRPGLRATQPRDGARFDRSRPAVAAYDRALVRGQDAVLGRIGNPPLLYRYLTALNGFAVRLDDRQAERLRALPGVVAVERSTRQRVDRVLGTPVVASSSRDLLGLDGRDGVWARHGGTDRAGRGVVIGVVDTGIWPANPSFSGLVQGPSGTSPDLPGFHGACAAAEEWTPGTCTDKVVSARWFVRGFGAENVASQEYLSARDGTGHGSHVASTAAGDYGVRVVIDGQLFGTTSGMAPAAHLAVYKACWAAPDPAQDGCSTADTVAAVDRAVADGVDVLNYSVSGSTAVADPVERAFLGAASAGVFVSTSAGNLGGPGSVRHVAPWVTTVAASSHHVFEGAVRLGDGTSLVGAMVSDQRVPSTGLVLGSDVAAPGATRADAGHCLPGTLDAVEAQGKIVVCDRGRGARVDKSAAVADAGGSGMVLANTRPRSTDADVHAVPTVHLQVGRAAAVKAYVRRSAGRATAALDPGGRDDVPAPAVADFSGRGPAQAFGGDVLKPDLTAPGVNVLGAVAPPSDSGRSWDLVSGTSTSAPHVAGLAAFVAGVHPDWSPARIKSAMMTTAYDVRGPRSPQVEGAGHIDPRRFLDPGLVFDTDVASWQGVLDGRVPARSLNTPFLAIGDLVGRATVERRVTNVSSRRETYAVRLDGLPGVDVQAFPATVRLGPGQTRTVRLRVTARPSATVDRDVTGWLVWRGDRHRVRIPVSVHPTVVVAPRQVDARADTGRVVVSGRSGNGRTVKLRSTALVPARTVPVDLRPGSFDVTDPQRDADTSGTDLRVPAGTDVARFAVTGDNVGVYVYRDGTLVDSATSGDATGADAAAEVTLTRPEPGNYTVYVNAQQGSPTPDAGTDSDADSGPSTVGELSTWVVPAEGGSQVDLSTDAVGFTAGKTFRYSASWDKLDPSKKYLGVVSYGDSDHQTLVEVH
jgi:Subtilase family/Fibronectin type-III domain/Peptidase inhibitor I9/PA domain